MNIQAEKIELTNLLLSTENPKILRSIRAIFPESKDFLNDLSLEQQQEIEQGSTEIENGEVTGYDTFMAKYRFTSL